MYEKKLQIPYYKHGNWKLDAERLDSIEQRVKVDENYKPNERLYTTFYNGFEDNALQSFYGNLGNQIAKEQAFFSNSFYSCIYWFQVYNKDAIHPRHTDFEVGENCILSFVHFLRVPSTPCFRFTDGRNHLVPPEQKEGDVIVYPSHVCHEVISHQEDDFNRIVAAGNINLISHNNAI